MLPKRCHFMRQGTLLLLLLVSGGAATHRLMCRSALMSLRELVASIARSGRFALICSAVAFSSSSEQLSSTRKHIYSPQLAYIVSRDLDDVFGISH
jgi:hypothetical protein